MKKLSTEIVVMIGVLSLFAGLVIGVIVGKSFFSSTIEVEVVKKSTVKKTTSKKSTKKIVDRSKEVAALKKQLIDLQADFKQIEIMLETQSGIVSVTSAELKEAEAEATKYQKDSNTAQVVAEDKAKLYKLLLQRYAALSRLSDRISDARVILAQYDLKLRLLHNLDPNKRRAAMYADDYVKKMTPHLKKIKTSRDVSLEAHTEAIEAAAADCKKYIDVWWGLAISWGV